jgi:hypothetical protein
MWFFLIFDVAFDPLWYMELPVFTRKVDPLSWRRKFRLAVFKFGNTLLMKDN